jgi:hypothetical protein
MVDNKEVPDGPEAMTAVSQIFADVSEKWQANQALDSRIDLLKDAVSGIQIVAGDELPEVVEVLGH